MFAQSCHCVDVTKSSTESAQLHVTLLGCKFCHHHSLMRKLKRPCPLFSFHILTPVPQQEQESATIQRSKTAAMNWMTSGRHRALGTRNARKKRLQMQLPAHIQRESEHRRLQSQQQQASHTIQPQLPLPSTLYVPNHRVARGEDHAAAKTPWYILPVNDADESQGLELSLVNVNMEKGCAPLRLTYRMFVSACRYQDAGIWAKSHLRKDGHNGASEADSAA